MASSSFTFTLSSPSSSTFRLRFETHSLFSSSASISFSHCLRATSAKSKSVDYLKRSSSDSVESFSVKAQTMDFSGSFFEQGLGSEDDPSSPAISGITALEEKEEPPCPPGLRKYETMVVLRPDMSEDGRVSLTQKYEELLVTGGGMYVEVFNRGVIPLAYGIKKKNKAGETNTYLDAIYLLFTYFTKPESLEILEETLKADDDVIRSMSFKIRNRKY